MRFFTKVKELFLRAMEKYSCDCCGREVFAYPARRLCERCEKRMTMNDGRTCFKCGRAMKAEGICLACKNEPPLFTKGFSPLVYHGESALLINRFKQGDRYLKSYFAEVMAKRLLAVPFDEPPLLVPVPITAEKRRKRGFNQSEELAVTLAKLTGYPVETGVLIKARDGEQKSLLAKERRERIRGTVRVKMRKVCAHKTVLVVDDIMTTGATGGECARVLLAAGAKEVYFIAACSLPHRE